MKVANHQLPISIIWRKGGEKKKCGMGYLIVMGNEALKCHA